MSAHVDPASIVVREVLPRDYEGWHDIQMARQALLDWLEGPEAPAGGSDPESIALNAWRAQAPKFGKQGDWYVLKTERERVEMRLDFDIAGDGECIRTTCHAVEVRCHQIQGGQ